MEKKNDSSRPLLLIFKARSDRDRLLDRAPRLSRHQDEEFRKISIVSDLTQKQRKLEQDMFKRAEKLNLERSSEMISKNLCHKVLGRRGERVLRQVELRETGVYILQMTRILFPGRTDPAPEIFAIEGNPTPPN